jgi:hypothetical protein
MINMMYASFEAVCVGVMNRPCGLVCGSVGYRSACTIVVRRLDARSSTIAHLRLTLTVGLNTQEGGFPIKLNKDGSTAIASKRECALINAGIIVTWTLSTIEHASKNIIFLSSVRIIRIISVVMFSSYRF